MDAAYVLILSSVSSAVANGYHMCAVISTMKMLYKLGMEVTIRVIVAGQKREKFCLWHVCFEAHTT